jgi:TfoX/Sxy family transcriptional regulator of competence genes
MPTFTKSSPRLIARFKAATPEDPAVEPRAMFGYPAFFVRGNFVAGLFAESVVVRMPEPQKSKLPALAGAEGFNPMGGKPMTDWWTLPSKVTADDKRLRDFLAAALAAAKSLPEKAAKAKAKAKPKPKPKAKPKKR